MFRNSQSGVGGLGDVHVFQLAAERCQEDLVGMEVPPGPHLRLEGPRLLQFPMCHHEVLLAVCREVLVEGLEQQPDFRFEPEGLAQRVGITEELCPLSLDLHAGT